MENAKIQIDRLNNAKATIAEAITAKGVQVPESTKLDGYPTLISQISTSGSGGGKSIRTCRIVVGTSKNGWTENDCDYLCDGVADNVEIQNAVNELSSGGEIVILSGEYDIAKSISLGSNKKISGNGSSTILNANYNKFTSIFSTNMRCVVENISFCVPSGITVGTNPYMLSISGYNTIISNCTFDSEIEGVYAIYASTNKVLITNNIINNNAHANGIKLGSTAQRVTLNGNIIENVKYAIDGGGASNLNNVLITNNAIESCYSVGITVNGTKTKITNNNINMSIVGSTSGTGIRSAGSLINVCNNTITNSYTGTFKSIELTTKSEDNFVVNNMLHKVDVTDGGTNNTINNNIVFS